MFKKKVHELAQAYRAFVVFFALWTSLMWGFLALWDSLMCVLLDLWAFLT